MTVILDHSFLYLNIGLVEKQNECLLESSALITLYPVSVGLNKV